MTPPQLPDSPMYEGIKEIYGYRDLDAAFRSHEMHIATHDPTSASHAFVGRTLLSMDGIEHAKTRRLQGSLFRPSALEYYEKEVIQPSIVECMDRLAGQSESGVVKADLVALCREMLCDVSTRLLGLGDLRDADRRRRFLRLSVLLAQGIGINWFDEAERAARLAEAEAAKRELWSDWIEPEWTRRHHARAENDGLPAPEEALDLLTLLAGLEDGLDDELLLRTCVIYMAGSINTTTQAVTHTFHYLRGWFDDHPERWPDRFDPNFLYSAGSEGLRLSPPIPAPLRRAAKPVELPSGEEIAQAQKVALHLTRANQDESAFGSCPASMDPDRKSAPGVKPYGHSFGGGPHLCIGRGVALPGRTATGRTQGAVVRMLAALYRAGIESDPDAQVPVIHSDRRDFITYPVRFTATDPRPAE